MVLLPMDGVQGALLWATFAPTIAARPGFSAPQLHILRAPLVLSPADPPRAVVWITSTTQRRTHLVALDHWTGAVLETVEWPFAVTSAFVLPAQPTATSAATTADAPLPLILIDQDLNVHVYPSTAKAAVIARLQAARKAASSKTKATEPAAAAPWFFHQVDQSTQDVQGFMLSLESDAQEAQASTATNRLVARAVWRVGFSEAHERIVDMAVHHPHERPFSAMRTAGVGEHSVVFKYLNPNLLCLVTQSGPVVSHQAEADAADDADGVTGVTGRAPETGLHVYVLDTVRGVIVAKWTQPGATGPAHVILSENVVIVHYYGGRAAQYEMAVMELTVCFFFSSSSNFRIFETRITRRLVMTKKRREECRRCFRPVLVMPMF